MIISPFSPQLLLLTAVFAWLSDSYVCCTVGCVGRSFMVSTVVVDGGYSEHRMFLMAVFIHCSPVLPCSLVYQSTLLICLIV